MIEQEYLPNYFFKLMAFFESENLQASLDGLVQRKGKYAIIYKKRPYFPFYTTFMCQSNKSVKLFRGHAIDAISQFETASHTNYLKLRDSKRLFPKLNSLYLKGNAIGVIMVSMITPVFDNAVTKGMACNSIINQHIVAEKILSYKLKEGAFPPSLADLGIDKAIYTDILTGNEFLYSAENGILQSIGKDKKNDNIELTTKILSPNEIHDILNDDKGECVFYLK
jgi:hypothetical protein